MDGGAHARFGSHHALGTPPGECQTRKEDGVSKESGTYTTAQQSLGNVSTAKHTAMVLKTG
jgi:hypothetical protein